MPLLMKSLADPDSGLSLSVYILFKWADLRCCASLFLFWNYDQCLLCLDIVYLTTKFFFSFFTETNYKYMYINYRPTKLFSNILSFILLVFTSDCYLLYSDVLIASNHEFVQSTKEIQVASLYILLLTSVAVFYTDSNSTGKETLVTDCLADSSSSPLEVNRLEVRY